MDFFKINIIIINLGSQGRLNQSRAEELNITQAFDDCTDRVCDYGLIMSQQMMEVCNLGKDILRGKNQNASRAILDHVCLGALDLCRVLRCNLVFSNCFISRCS